MILIAKQRDEDLRMAFANDVSMYDSEKLVFIDETGADRRNTIRKHGYIVLEESQLKAMNFFLRSAIFDCFHVSKRVTLLDCKIIHGSVNSDSFYEFIATYPPD